MKYHLTFGALACALALSACGNNKASGGNPAPAPAPQVNAIVGYAQQLAATAPDDAEPDEVDATNVDVADNTEPSNL